MSGVHVAWIGLGNIGRGMSANIAQKGPQASLTLYNRTTSRAITHAETLNQPDKIKVATTLPEAIANADIVFTCVGDDAALDAITSGILADSTDLSQKTFVDCSTVHPDTSRRTESAYAARGAGFVASPVFGAPNMADIGQLIIVPAGKQASIAKARPFYEGVTASRTIDLSSGTGEDIDVGRATTMKVIGNTFILNTVGVLAEALTAAETTGLGVGPLKEWLDVFAPGPFAKYAGRMVTGDYYLRDEPLFAVDLARKDLRHASGIAKEAGQRMRNVEVTDHFLSIVKEEMGEKGDIAGVYGAIRKEAGLEYGNQK
ncbi:uncharacterized protein N7483_003190 [Penicillium malachiteum]|uniref:uncharacterized protein n=1 Tax=Penicillium malachiteum TaxID=1324776 RepID=UPI002549791E|nr:uncharacterized protein N7483_003190 [Penicillium malachiteum]KAJ5728682.1 hypothetical protein N7483_003190 [Penicillium malachiteum]